MHEWFATPLAAGRMENMQQRATAHRLRVARGRDLTARLSGPLLSAADRGAARLDRRRNSAAGVVGPACC